VDIVMSNAKEAHTRIKINNMLVEAGWHLIDEPENNIKEGTEKVGCFW
jgi:hypothetical protein